MAKASSLVIWIAATALFGLATFGQMSAQAAAPEFLRQFGNNCGIQSKVENGECAAAGETAFPRGIGIDEQSGHIFVADQQNFRVDEFTPWGEFVKAFGWDVAPGGVNEEQEVRIRAAGGQFKLSFGVDTTLDLPFDANGGEIETALNGLASIGSGGVSVKEVIGNPNGKTPYVYVVEFVGNSLKESDVSELEISAGTTSLAGGDPATEMQTRTRVNGTPGGTGLEACAASCQVGVGDSGAGQFNRPQGLTIDALGDIYVFDWENYRLQKFDSSGRFLWMVGGGVDQGPNHPGNLCLAAYLTEGDTCGVGAPGSGNGEFSALMPASSFIAMGPENTVYVGDDNRIQKFGADGTYKGEVAVTGLVSSLAVDPVGNLYVTFADETLQHRPKPNVHKFTSSGAQICEISVGWPTALAVDGTGGVYVTSHLVVESTTDKENEVRHFDSSCNNLDEGFAGSEFEESTGSAVNKLGNFLLSNANDGGANSFINLYGPAPIAFESPPPVPPQIMAQYASAVGAETATLQAQINPRFWPDATYYIEYGTSDCAGGGCVSQPASPGAPLTGASISSAVTTEGISLSGLMPNTVYHYRFVSLSGGGGPVPGPDRTFRTRSDGASLPDGRTYELTSPIAKGGGEVGIPGAAGGGAEFSVQPQQSSPTGSAVTYASFTAFEGPKSAPAASQYLSQSAGPGTWSTANINPRFEEGYTRDPLVGFSEDLSHGAVIAIEPALTGDATIGFPNLYWRDNVSGALTAITTQEHTPEIAVPHGNYCLYYGGSSADSKRVFFGAKGALIAGDPTADGFNLYEWSAAGGLRLVSVLPDGSSGTPTIYTSFGGLGFNLSSCATSETPMRHAISSDGSKVFWSSRVTYLGAKEPLFARVGGSETIRLDKPNSGVAKGGEGRYQDASTDGSKVFFTDTNKLTAQPTTAGSSDLYLYDFDQPDGSRLTNLTAHTGEAANVGGVVGVSRDGAYAYFVAKGVLDVGAAAGQNNLYAWNDGGGIRFLATLAAGDSRAWSDIPSQQNARVSPDGRHLAFLSARSLTGFDNVDSVTGKVDDEAYLYSFEADALSCISCTPSRARPSGSASLPAWSTPYQQPRYLSDDGGRVLFETLDSLDPRDTNGKRDVYEFEKLDAGSCSAASPAFSPDSNGCVYLISSGKSDDASYLLDASTSADDIFFSTRESLVFTDRDERYDVYDARVGGTLPPSPPVRCEGEDCRGPSPQPPPPPSPGTPDFQGPGNPQPKQGCPKGTHKVKSHGKVRCAKAKKKPKRNKSRKHRAQPNGKAGR